MSTRLANSLRAGVVVTAPLMFLAALSYHPYLPGRQPNTEAVAAAVVSGPTNWGVVHLGTGLASAMLVVAFLAVRAELREAGEDRWSGVAVPFIVFGNTLYAMLPAMELAPLAAAEAGGDAQLAQAALLPWFIPVLAASGLTFAVGLATLAVGVVRSGLLSPGLAKVVATALVVAALSRFVPLSAVQLYLQGVAVLVALVPLAHHISQRGTVQVGAHQLA